MNRIAFKTPDTPWTAGKTDARRPSLIRREYTYPRQERVRLISTAEDTEEEMR